ncbi:hypothetical protein [Actinomadura sp. 9N407]|uniref:hypothetical protein n=1 Tax=Actinomadura sp. 9N407 TaxID=3375154 RepID=UPI0037BB7462
MQAIRSFFNSTFLNRTLKPARRIGLPLAIVIAGLLTGLGYGLLKTPAYSATSYVLLVSQNDEGPPVAVSFAQAYGRLAALPETLAWAAVPLPPADLADARRNIQASTSPDTPLVRLTASARTPRRAATFANTAADALVRYGNAHQQDTGVRVALMTRAAAPFGPSSPNLPLNVAVGTATGILLAGLVAATGAGTRLRRRQGGTGPTSDRRPSAGPRAPKARTRQRSEPAAMDLGEAGPQTAGGRDAEFQEAASQDAASEVHAEAAK